MARKLALVTGAAGFVGSHAVPAMREAGFDVRATDRVRAPHLERADVEFVPADLTDPGSLDAALDGVDVVVNVASVFDYSAPWELLERVNLHGMRSLCEAALREDVERFVHVSSVAVYGRPLRGELPVRESNPLRGESAGLYDRSKKLQEDIGWEHARKGLPFVAARPAPIYGVGARYGMALAFGMFARGEIQGYPRNIAHNHMPLVHVSDVAGALAHLARTPGVLGEAYNVADDNRYLMKDVLDFLAPLVQTKVINFPPSPTWLIRAELGLLAKMAEWSARRKGLPRPKIERDTLVYLEADFQYSNEKLKASGYALRYPDTLAGLFATLPWYLEEWGLAEAPRGGSAAKAPATRPAGGAAEGAR